MSSPVRFCLTVSVCSMESLDPITDEFIVLPLPTTFDPDALHTGFAASVASILLSRVRLPFVALPTTLRHNPRTPPIQPPQAAVQVGQAGQALSIEYRLELHGTTNIPGSQSR
jgi:hypothetical protein